MSNDNDARSIGRLIDRERIRGASRMIPEGTEAKAVTDEQIAQVADDVRLFCREHKITIKQLAKLIGWSEPVVCDFLNGKYKGDRGEVAIDLESWLTEEEQRRLRPQTTQFVWTNVALEIKATASYCLDYKKIGLIYGPDASGIGKTIALRAIHQELGVRRSTFCSLNKVEANPTGLLRKLCESVHVDPSGTNARRFDRLVKFLRGRSHLLIIDEIHALCNAKDDKPLYYLKDLFVETETAQLWCGTADMLAYLHRQQRKQLNESLAQVRRRVCPVIDLMEEARRGGGNGAPLVTTDQIREMFAKNRLKLTPAGARFLTMVANTPDSGSVGICVEAVEYATAHGFNLTVLDVPALKQALEKTAGVERAEFTLHAIGETTARLSKVG